MVLIPDALHLLPMLFSFMGLGVELGESAPAVHLEDDLLLGDVSTRQGAQLDVVLGDEVEAVVGLLSSGTEEPGEFLRQYLLAVHEP